MTSTLIIIVIIFVLVLNVCILSQTAGISRVINGLEANLKQFPYVVYLDIRSEPDEVGAGWICSGSLLTDQWVLTAAHCYTGLYDKGVDMSHVITQVKAGTIDQSIMTEYTQNRIAKYHVFFDSTPYFKVNWMLANDMVILKVTKRFELNGYVDAIAIARYPIPYDKRVTCTVMGFGRASFTHHNTKLLHAQARLDQDKYGCRKRAEIGGYDSGYLQDWTEKHLCLETLDYRQSVCNGDSGGPVVCEGLHTGVSSGMRNMNQSYYDHFNCSDRGVFQIYMFTGIYEMWLRTYIPELQPSRLIEGDKILPRQISRGGDTPRGDGHLHASSGGLLLVGGVLCYFRSL